MITAKFSLVVVVAVFVVFAVLHLHGKGHGMLGHLGQAIHGSHR